jgi:hypothetical protein
MNLLITCEIKYLKCEMKGDEKKDSFDFNLCNPELDAKIGGALI